MVDTKLIIIIIIINIHITKIKNTSIMEKHKNGRSNNNETKIIYESCLGGEGAFCAL